ncbi:unnamed protein product, partial [Musa acuminata subsp. burmannicoides]
RIGLHKNGQIGSRSRISKGVIHVQVSFNNTIVIIIDIRGRVVSWAATNTSEFKETRRGTPYATQAAASNAISEVMIKSFGHRRDAVLQAIYRSGILLSFVCDVTPMPHNGCRPPKKRHVVIIKK